MKRDISVGLNAVIVAVARDEPLTLVVRSYEADGLPFGPLDAGRHATLELGLRSWVREQTGLELGYSEQLYTFGDRDRDTAAGDRVLSVVYLALSRERPVPMAEARWESIYRYLPWEDWRRGRPSMLARDVEPGLRRWLGQVGPAREHRQRCRVAFGTDGSVWNSERVLERYELLYEAGLVREGVAAGGGERGAQVGTAMRLDHRRMLATALGRLRGKIRYRPVIFELLGERFTLFQLQKVAEALAGTPLHKQNFRRLVLRGRLVEGTGKLDSNTGGRPAELFRFRQEVLGERPAPGVGLPGLPD